MPLRDHFSKKVPKRFHWEEFHSTWPVTIARHLNRALLPAGYHAGPRVRLGTFAEIDVGTREAEAASIQDLPAVSASGVALYSPPKPALTFETDLSQEDLFEVQVFDDELGEHLVAAIELISPSNKDRPQSRHEFIVK